MTYDTAAQFATRPDLLQACRHIERQPENSIGDPLFEHDARLLAAVVPTLLDDLREMARIAREYDIRRSNLLREMSRLCGEARRLSPGGGFEVSDANELIPMPASNAVAGSANERK